jgi:hypothetical protein
MPSTLITSEPKVSLKLKGGNALFGRAHQVEGDNPLADRNMRGFHHRPHGYGEGLPTFFTLALKKTGAVGFPMDCPGTLMPTMGTYRASGPKDILNVFTGLPFGKLGNFIEIHLAYPLYLILWVKDNTYFRVCQADKSEDI